MVMLVRSACWRGSLLAGLPFVDIFAGRGVEDSSRVDQDRPRQSRSRAMHETPLWVKFLPTVMMLAGWGVAAWFYLVRPDMPVALAAASGLYRFPAQQWYFDELYDVIFVRPTIWLGRLL